MSAEKINNYKFDIGEAVESAARDLPSGCIIRIEIEREGYGVWLERSGHPGLLIGQDGGLAADINEAVCIANGSLH